MRQVALWLMRFDSLAEAKSDEEEDGLAMAMAAVATTPSSSLDSSPEGYSSWVTNAFGGIPFFLSKFLEGNNLAFISLRKSLPLWSSTLSYGHSTMKWCWLPQL